MDIENVVKQIDSLEKDVQDPVNAYVDDADFTWLIDSHLNGHMKVIQAYCKLNNLQVYLDTINECLPVDRNAVEFFCLWDGIKEDIFQHSKGLQGKDRQRIISSIVRTLSASMTFSQIDAYLTGFSVPSPIGVSCEHSSKRVYIEAALKPVDGSMVLTIAKDLGLFCEDVIVTEAIEEINSEFISQQVAKCKKKIGAGDYDGAITNARTLLEEVLLHVETQLAGERLEYDGNLPSLYKRVSKKINMYPDKGTENSFNEILRGFISIVSGFSGISNTIADRHATVRHPQKHHAKIAVNGAMIISEFIIESFSYQKEKNQR